MAYVPHYRFSLIRERSTRYTVNDPHACAKVCHALLDDSPVEKLLVLYLNGQNAIIGSEFVSQGGVSGTATSPADVFRGAIVAGASGIVLSHNHPSETCAPSSEDTDLTRRVVRAGNVLGVHVLDHIIVCPNGRHYSMFEGVPEVFS
jgi:DNA repair protein RadC